jgi:hypothetical protein
MPKAFIANSNNSGAASSLNAQLRCCLVARYWSFYCGDFCTLLLRAGLLM